MLPGTTFHQSAMHMVPGVHEVHDLHIWTVAPGRIALSAHVTLSDRTLSQSAEIITGLKAFQHDRFRDPPHYHSIRICCLWSGSYSLCPWEYIVTLKITKYCGINKCSL